MLLSLLSKRLLDVDARDAYGFTVRPQHVSKYREYANIYKQEEEERLQKWNWFVKQQTEHTRTAQPSSADENVETVESKARDATATCGGDQSGIDILKETDNNAEKVVPAAVITRTKSRNKVQKWVPVRQSLNQIESMMSSRIHNKREDDMKVEQRTMMLSIDEEAVCDNSIDYSGNEEHAEISKQELEFLVHGGVPRDLRGEVWQAFVGVRTRRIEQYYQNLLDPEIVSGDDEEPDKSESGEDGKGPSESRVPLSEKLRKQIEKDLTRTFPGHPALDENGRSSLRRLLLAYARHNPSVGYCQAMNFFAGLLLLMMPEENAFWALVAIIDDYFDGYYSQEMIESQVDQLVFEDLVRERFPKLVNHLDYLGVQVTWISGPWFLSIFVNMLPWESVLRIWDVLLFEGNRVMLFRTALALLELYGPAICTMQDAPDAISSLQSLAGSTFDSSQLVLTACMGFLTVTEDRLQELREKHRPSVLGVIEERSKGARVWKDPKGLATKLYSFKHNPEAPLEVPGESTINRDVSSSDTHSIDLDKMMAGLDMGSEIDSLPMQEQVIWLKAELCRLMDDKRTTVLRAEELETALMEMVQQDNRRELSARVEQLEKEISLLRQALSDKGEKECSLIQVMMRVEQDQKSTEEARIRAEKDAAAQKHAVKVLQEKYDKAMTAIAKMEKRVVMAESMLEATLQYESGQVKALASPGPSRPGSPRENNPKKPGLLSFGLGWRDKNKGKQNNSAVAADKYSSDGEEASSVQVQENGHRDSGKAPPPAQAQSPAGQRGKTKQ